VSEPGSRLRASVVTFGPVGRIVCTVFLLAVLGWFVLYGGLFGVAGAVVWCGWVLPRALRDTWQPAQLPATDLTRLRDATAREVAEREQPQQSHAAFDPETRPPTRW
jgi:hypothetical protein